MFDIIGNLLIIIAGLIWLLMGVIDYLDPYMPNPVAVVRGLAGLSVLCFGIHNIFMLCVGVS